MLLNKKMIEAYRVMFEKDLNHEVQVLREAAHEKIELCDLALKGLAVPEARATVEGPDEFGSVYVCFQPGRSGEDGAVTNTTQHHRGTMVDYDKDGKLFGIEVLSVRSVKV